MMEADFKDERDVYSSNNAENKKLESTKKLLPNNENVNCSVTSERFTETTYYTSTEQDGIKDFRQSTGCLSQRWVLGYMGLWLGIMTFLFSSNMSVAIVCMVKTSSIRAPHSDHIVNSDVQTFSNDTLENNTTVVLEEPERKVPTIADDIKDIDSHCSHNASNDVSENMYQGAEFDWTKKTQSFVLSGYFYGYVFVQIPAGWLVAKFGGKWIVGIGMVLSCLATLLTPVFARTSVYLVVAARLLQGLCNGMNSASYCGLVGIWALPTERSRLLAMCWFGQMVGAVLGYSTSGMLCAHGFGNGWPSVFYIHGMICVLFVICWWYFVHNSPDQHPRISEAEKSLLLQNFKPTNQKQKISVPWRHILTYRPIYIMYIANVCDCWTFYLLFTSLPQFMKEVLKFDIQSNGLFSCLPFLTMMCGIALAGVAADVLRSKNVFTITTIRKLFQVSAFIGVSAFILVPGFMTCDQRAVVIVCVCASTFVGAIGMTAGYSCNPIDIAPRYASLIFGISNTVGSLPGIIAPVVVAEMTKNQTSEEWRTVFYTTSGVAIFGALMYGLLANLEVASWDSISSIELDIACPPSDKKLTECSDHSNKGLP